MKSRFLIIFGIIGITVAGISSISYGEFEKIPYGSCDMNLEWEYSEWLGVPDYLNQLQRCVSNIPFTMQNAYAVLSPLKQQIQERSDPETYVCWNLEQVLIERQNGKYACVYPYTAVKLNWEFLNEYNLSQMNTRNGNFTVFTHLSRGALTDVIFADTYPGIIIKMSTGEAGKLSIKIPVEMMKDTENCLPQPVYPNYDVFITLVNGVEVDYNERITTETSRFVELQYDKDATEIEIIDVCLI